MANIVWNILYGLKYNGGTPMDNDITDALFTFNLSILHSHCKEGARDVNDD